MNHLLLLLLLLLLLYNIPSFTHAQQSYVNNEQLACYIVTNSTLGYVCNGAAPSCTSYLFFRSQTDYQTPDQIARLLSADPSAISALNSFPAPPHSPIIVPINCSCTTAGTAGRRYQHDASYTLRFSGETYLLVANDTYEGLSACQALIAQNPTYPAQSLTPGTRIRVPLRCACPTRRQLAAGARYLLSYIITFGDDIPTIAQRFNASEQSVLDANDLISGQTIFPFNTLLVPLATEPSKLDLSVPPPPPVNTPPPAAAQGVGGGGSSSKKWVAIAVGAGVGTAVLATCAILLVCCFFRRRARKPDRPLPVIKKPDRDSTGGTLSAPLVISDEIRMVIESMTVYSFRDLEKATGCFDEDHQINGSAVYHAVINGDNAAVKRLPTGDVASVTEEIGILKQISHSNVIRLSGICQHEGDTYLVYEYAANGSLTDWLRCDGKDGELLDWKQRVGIAYNVADGLNYLHNYTNPPYIHKDVRSSNILLNGEFRAKVASFGLARPVKSYESSNILTRHVVGTQGYMAPEYLEHGLVTPKLDVFAFGVVMLELLSGKEAVLPKEDGQKGEVLLSSLIEPVLSGEDIKSKLRGFLDPRVGNHYPFDLAFAMAQLAMRCVSHDPAARPAMADVLMSLSAIYNSTMDWDPSDISKSDSMVHSG